MNHRRLCVRGSALILLLLLAACARMMPTPPPAPTPTGPVKPAPPVLPEPEPAGPPTQPKVPEPAVIVPKKAPPPPSPPAVVALMDQAETAANAGEWDASAATLERAIRIQPRNPVLWHRLARVRMQQGQLQSAEDLAKKSNIYAGSDQGLVQQNWRLIAEARQRRGDMEGAKDAEAKAGR